MCVYSSIKEQFTLQQNPYGAKGKPQEYSEIPEKKIPYSLCIVVAQARHHHLHLYC